MESPGLHFSAPLPLAPVSAAALASKSAASLPEKPTYVGIQWIIRIEGDMVVNFSEYVLVGRFGFKDKPKNNGDNPPAGVSD